MSNLLSSDQRSREYAADQNSSGERDNGRDLDTKGTRNSLSTKTIRCDLDVADLQVSDRPNSCVRDANEGEHESKDDTRGHCHWKSKLPNRLAPLRRFGSRPILMTIN